MMKPKSLIALAVMAGIVAAAVSTPGCSTTSQAPAHSGPASAPNGTSATATAAGPVPTTLEQLCDAQTWPRPVPDVVGKILNQVTKQGALGCWDTIHGVAPDGHDPLNNPAGPADVGAYRITAVSPPPGTPIGRHNAVTVQLAEVDPKAPPAFRPCDLVTTDEAAGILGGPVTATPLLDEAGSVEMSCGYNKSQDSGVESDLLVPGAFSVDAASQFALATAKNASTTVVDGLGVKAACVSDPGTTPPSTTLLVLLNGNRLYRATGKYYMPCDSLKQFAQTAIGRIGA